MTDTNQALQALLQAGLGKVMPFPPTSRYYGVDTVTMQSADGRTVIYLRRRFVPSPGNFALLQYHTVTQDERLDNNTAKYLNDPEQFRRVCDANGAPEGIPAAPNA